MQSHSIPCAEPRQSDSGVAETLRLERERSILSGVLADASLLDDLHGLTPEHFTDYGCRNVFATCRTLHAGGIVPSVLTVADYVDRHGDLGESLGPDWLNWLLSLHDGLPCPQPDLLVREMREDYDRRRLLTLIGSAEHMVRSGQPVETILGDIQRFIDSAETCRGDPVVLSGPELDAADFPMDYLVSGVLVRGQPCILGGGKKTLKTNIAIDLTLSLASGAKFLGEFYVPRAVRTALISGESGAATIQETARRIAKSKPWIHLGDYENALFRFDLPTFGRPDSMIELRRFIIKNRIEVLIIDPAYLCLPLDDKAGNVFSVGGVLNPIGKLMHDLGVTPIICHHTTKAATYSRELPELGDLAWAGFAEWARQWLLLARREAYDPDAPGDHRLWLVAGGSAGHSAARAVDISEGSRDDVGGRCWEVSVCAVGEAKADAVDAAEAAKLERQRASSERQVTADMAAVVETLERHPDGLTLSKLRDLSGVRGPRLAPVLRRLQDDQTVEACTIQCANKQAYEGFRVSLGRTRTHSDALGQKHLSDCPTHSDTHTRTTPL